LNLLDILFLALLQGIAEFIPVSSSGHLVLAQHFLGVSAPGIAVEVVLHLGTLAAVLAFYAKDIISLAGGALRLRKPELTLLGLLAVASIPAGVVGMLFEKALERLFDSPLAVSLLLVANGAILFWGGRARAARRPDPQGPGSPPGAGPALAAGLAQAVAVLPGISRSGSTISALMRRGVGPVRAARFSFLLSIPAVAGAGLLQAVHGFPPGSPSISMLAIGFLVSFLVGLASLAVLLGVLAKGRLWLFGAYCAAAGAACATAVLSGV